MAASSLQYNNDLVRIRRQYIDSLPDKIHALEAALSNLSDSDRPDRELKDLHRIAHQLAASAGSHGLLQVSRVARELDDLSDDVPTPVDENVAQAVQEMGDALVDLLRQVPA
ncbi:MAG: Hpt domain-containing protein [Pseudomonadota bacterium]